MNVMIDHSARNGTDAGKHALIPHNRSAVGMLVFILIGIIVWAVHFAVAYAAQSVLCVLDGRQGPSSVADVSASVSVMIWTATALALAILIAVAAAPAVAARFLSAAAPDGGIEKSYLTIMLSVALLSAFGIIWVQQVALLIPTCAAMR